MKKEVILSFLGAALFWIPILAIIVYTGHKNTYDNCETLSIDVLPKVCKLHYPILNKEEIKNIVNENEELKEKISELENRLDDVKDVLENGKDDNWQPDPQQIEY